MRDEHKIKAADALEHDVEVGLKDLDSGRFEVYAEANLIDLANEVCCSGRKRLNAMMEADPTKAYNQDDATGFIRLNGLRLKVAAKVQRKQNEMPALHN